VKNDVSLCAVVSLGANQECPEETINRALRRLHSLSDLPLECSSLWRTEPVDCPPGSGSFINAVVALIPRSDETPETLLATLQGVEREFGRQRNPIPNAPRPLDLDLIFFARELRESALLTLPHPRWMKRRFVLEPLAELDRAYIAPGQTRTVAQLLEELSDNHAAVRVAEGGG